MQELWPGMLAGDFEAEKEWLIESEKLVETFRETRNLFLTSRVSRLFMILFNLVHDLPDSSFSRDVSQKKDKATSGG